MARFVAQLPTEILKDVNFLEKNALEIFGGMTKAGAQHAGENMKARAAGAFKNGTGTKVASKLKVTKTYETKKKEITTKAAFYGYIPRKNGSRVKIKGNYYSGVPVPLLCNLVEYGVKSSAMPRPFKDYWDGQKHPIVRPAFSDTQGIQAAMLKAQTQLSGGLLK